MEHSQKYVYGTRHVVIISLAFPVLSVGNDGKDGTGPLGLCMYDGYRHPDGWNIEVIMS